MNEVEHAKDVFGKGRDALDDDGRGVGGRQRLRLRVDKNAVGPRVVVHIGPRAAHVAA